MLKNQTGNTTTEIQPISNVGFNQTFSFAFSDFKVRFFVLYLLLIQMKFLRKMR